MKKAKNANWIVTATIVFCIGIFLYSNAEIIYAKSDVKSLMQNNMKENGQSKYVVKEGTSHVYLNAAEDKQRFMSAFDKAALQDPNIQYGTWRSIKIYFDMTYICHYDGGGLIGINGDVYLLHDDDAIWLQGKLNNFPKPKITCGGKDIIYAILPNHFEGASYDRLGYWDILTTDRYTTLAKIGDEIQFDFGNNPPEKLVLKYDSNTSPLTSANNIPKTTEIQNKFTIKEDYINAINKDVMYYVTATWENGNSMEYAFLIITDSSIKITRTDVSPSFKINMPPRPTTPTISNIEITISKAEIAPRHIDVSDIKVISGLSEFDAINLDGTTLENSKTSGVGKELFVPLEAVSKALKYEITWLSDTNSVVIVNRNENAYFDSLKFTTGSNKATLQRNLTAKEVRTIAKPLIKDSVLYISLKDCIKFFGIELEQSSEVMRIEPEKDSILFLRSIQSEALYNEALDEVYNGKFLKWDDEKKNYIFITEEFKNQEYHLNKDQWATLHRSSQNPVDLALLYYVDSSEKYFKENPIMSFDSHLCLNEDGMKVIEELGIKNIPELLKHVNENSPFYFECMASISRMLEIHYEYSNITGWKSQVNERITGAAEAVK